mmetsp:Transcript_36937/g.83521  ORF Transcript_36937/g.83521 Transcript_36937/m.83521 type:complete len:136 (+) Transcript_36937:77-484(+)
MAGSIAAMVACPQVGATRVEFIQIGSKEYEEVVIDGSWGPRRVRQAPLPPTYQYFEYATLNIKCLSLGNPMGAQIKSWKQLSSTEQKTLLVLTAKWNKRMRSQFGNEEWWEKAYEVASEVEPPPAEEQWAQVEDK